MVDHRVMLRFTLHDWIELVSPSKRGSLKGYFSLHYKNRIAGRLSVDISNGKSRGCTLSISSVGVTVKLGVSDVEQGIFTVICFKWGCQCTSMNIQLRQTFVNLVDVKELTGVWNGSEWVKTNCLVSKGLG